MTDNVFSPGNYNYLFSLVAEHLKFFLMNMGTYSQRFVIWKNSIPTGDIGSEITCMEKKKQFIEIFLLE